MAEDGDEEEVKGAEAVEGWYNALGLPKPFTAPRRLSEGVWRPDLRLVQLTTTKGQWFKTMGFSHGKEEFYHVEEAVFLADQALLRILHHDVELSLAQVFRLLSEGGVPLDHYIAYAHLTRLGFILARTRLPLHEGQSPAAAEDRTPRVLFDVWKAQKKGFKKSQVDSLRPDFRLCVVGQSDPPPSPAHIRNLLERSPGVPVRFGVVDGGAVSFASFETLTFASSTT